MAKYIEGTNIPVKDFKGSSDELEELENRIAEDIAKGDWAGANDALFSIAYKSGKTGGQGNPSVGKVQSGQYRVTGKSSGGEKSDESWAQSSVKKAQSGESDIYIQRDDQGNIKEDKQGRPVVVKGEDYGKPMTADDVARSTAGVTRFAGTNIPTTGIPAHIRDEINRGLLEDIAYAKETGDDDPAARSIFGAASALWKASGRDADLEPAAYKNFMAQVTSGQYKFNPDTGLTNYADIVTEDPTRGTSDTYNIRDLSGKVIRTVSGKDYTGKPTYDPSQIGAGGSGEYLSTPYSRPALQDWSHLAPPTMPGLLGTAQAQQSLLGNNLAAYQPQAQGGVLDYAPRGGSAWAPRTYAANPLGGDQTTSGDTTDNGTTTTAKTFMGQTYNNQGEYMRLLDTHNKAMQLIRGGRTTMGIGELMGNSGLVNQMYMNVGNKFGGYTGGTDISVGNGQNNQGIVVDTTTTTGNGYTSGGQHLI